MKEYIPILIVFIFVAGFAVTNIVLSHVVGKRKDTRAKLMPYECGMDPVGSAHQRFSVKFYMVAVLFIIFDIETVFMIPWGAHFRVLSCAVPLNSGVCPAGQTSFFGLTEMLVFIAILLVGFIYVWKKGALQWD